LVYKHSWLLELHIKISIEGSVLLAGIVMKYEYIGLIRFYVGLDLVLCIGVVDLVCFGMINVWNIIMFILVVIVLVYL